MVDLEFPFDVYLNPINPWNDTELKIKEYTVYIDKPLTVDKKIWKNISFMEKYLTKSNISETQTIKKRGRPKTKE